jgi:hypothetical protein
VIPASEATRQGKEITTVNYRKEEFLSLFIDNLMIRNKNLLIRTTCSNF